jgi:DNA polymerase I-like protein with 3'-5' exonuclease and polymerase domains
MEYNGLPFSRDIWYNMHVENDKKYYVRFDELNQYIINSVPKFATNTLFGMEANVDWKSPQSVVRLFKHLGACPQEKSKQTKQLEDSVSSKAMLPTLSNDFKDDYGKDKGREIIDTDTLKLAYLLLRKTQMNITTYGKDFLKYIHPITGRVHPNYRLHLISSRTATTSPNLLAIPGGHRVAFTNEGTDRVLVVNDYSSQESRVIAAKSGDPLLITFFNVGHEVFGGDFHSYTSALVHQVRNPESRLKIVPKEIPGTDKRHPDFTPEMGKMRQDTKAVNFGLAYGITAISLSKQLGIPMIEAEDLVDSYFETFTDLKTFLRDSQSAAIRNGYVVFEPMFDAIFIQRDYASILKKEETCKSFFFNDYYKELDTEQRAEYKAELYRTKPHIKEWFSEVGTVKSRLGNRGCNLKIQGTSAKQSKVAQLNIRKYSILHPELDWKQCLLLHDEIVSDVPEEHQDVVVKLQGQYMKAAAEYFCPNVKFETSGGASKEWEH